MTEKEQKKPTSESDCGEILPVEQTPLTAVGLNAAKIYGKKSFLQRVADKFHGLKGKPFSAFLYIALLISTTLTMVALLFIITYILVMGVPHLTPDLFAWEYNSDNVSMTPAIVNTLTMVGLSLLFAVPIGIFAAIYLVEYSGRGNKAVKVVRMAAETLAGIPSIVYGLFGMLFFVTTCKMGYSMLAGALTMAIMILPLVMRTTEEALLSVSDSLREGSLALGAGKLRTIFRVVLPGAVPGILSGVILAVGRVVGETAALMFTAGTVAQIPPNLLGSGRTLALHMYVLSCEGIHTDQAYATAVVLLVMVLVINVISGLIAKKFTEGTK